VSSAGGSRPSWRADGEELYYVDAKGALVAVPVARSDAFEAGAAETLFVTQLPPMLAPYRGTYAATGDGQRFLVERMLPDTTPSTITIFVDWAASLKDRSAAEGALGVARVPRP
jgi:hypothetical protein